MQYVIFNDALAHFTFFKPVDGTLETLLGGELPEINNFLRESLKVWSLETAGLLKYLEARGVTDKNTLPHYPFRDQGRLIWDSTEKFVTSYVKAIYSSDKDVQDDYELQVIAF